MRSINKLIARTACAIAAPLILTLGVTAATPSPTDAYLQYHAAIVDASDVSAVAPLMVRSVNEDISHVPTQMKPMYFGMIKNLAPRNVQVVSEKVDGDKAQLALSSNSKDKKSGTVTLLREDGVWKVEKEAWTASVGAAGAPLRTGQQ